MKVKSERGVLMSCPKCCGRGVDRRGRVCGYHEPKPEWMAAFIVAQQKEIERLHKLLNGESTPRIMDEAEGPE